MDYSYYTGPPAQAFSMYGLPTPGQPGHAPLDDTFASLDNYEKDFPGFDAPFRPEPTSHLPPYSSPDSFSKHSTTSSDAAHNQHTDPTSIDGDEVQFNDPSIVRSSSEEKESDPTESKRKAQNRAAQRAFRERKERHVRELQDKVSALEQTSDTLRSDNERLKRELARFATENEILRATSQPSNHGPVPADPEPTVMGPMRYSPTDFYSTLLPEGPPAHGSSQHRITVCPVTGDRLLDAHALWDLLQGHELFKRGQIDIAHVVERVKGKAQCDGQGPAFREGQVLQIIEESAALGRDELI
ncbi:hypothetical protein N7535_000956 [Penicillium sp. DV-2018c]|nr:hypothetical protein N7461_005800 [Penicillium sp. DV-2018c]KAJ5582336.1 hypothetical protein N7535_000956 [Penicillium sp. DV-2018c]